MIRSLVIGTAGHIDHGKSSLVEALTGIHPDRLKEEQERGITIDLGFANLSLGETCQVGFVDVPGHERFIKNMLAGVGGIDAVLLVVAADESVMPQTREHFDICRLLSIQTGVLAITKADLVPEDLLELVALEIQEFVRGSFLEGKPIIPVSARSGRGLAELKEALLGVCKSTPQRDWRTAFRMPIDRCFTLRGFGTVVTGTLLSGSLRKEDEVKLYPVGLKARIRGLQVHSESVEQACAGQRVAINLPNLEVGQIRRGMEISVPGRFRPVSTCFARAELLPSAPAYLARRTQVRFHHGSSEIMATIKPVSGSEIQPGQAGFVRVALKQSILMLPGDKFIIRRLSPMATLGGGTVLDICPPRGKESANGIVASLESIASLAPHELLLQQARRNGFRGLSEHQMLSQTVLGRNAVLDIARSLVQRGVLRLVSEEPFLLMDGSCFTQVTEHLLTILEEFHQQNRLAAGISKEQLGSSTGRVLQPSALRAALNELALQNKIVIDNDLVHLPNRPVVLGEAESAAKEQIERAFQQAGWKVPVLDEVLAALTIPKDQARKLVVLLAKEKRLIKVSESLVFHSDSISRLKLLLSNYRTQSDRIDVGKFKDLTDISRKYAIPLLEYLDRERVTRRVGDHRLIL